MAGLTGSAAPGVINLVPLAGGERTWLDYEHPDYQAHIRRWTFTNDHYTGDLVDPNRIQQYLRKRTLGENEVAFKERCDLADYTNHFAAILDSIAGMLFAVEGDANRILNKIVEGPNGASVQEVLGDFAVSGSVMGRLYLDADGQGNGYMSIFKMLATEIMTLQHAWILVDAADGDPQIKVYPATAVPNWISDGQGLKQVLIKEKIDGRASLRDDYNLREVQSYVMIGRDRWERWNRNQEGQPEMVEWGEHSYVNRNGKRDLPIFRVSLPLRRMVGWQLAVKANRIFNQESMRDHLLRVANAPKLNIIGTDSQFDKITERLEQGSNALQVDPNSKNIHGFIAPSSEPATVLSKVIERKIEEFYISAFRMYGDSAKEKTATEAKQDVSQGIGAFLQLLKASIDGAENQVLWRLEQIEYPRNKNNWFVARVERSDDFLPTNVDAAIEKIRERYFGKGGVVPVGRSTMISAIKTITSWDGLVLSDQEIEAAVDAHIMSKGFEQLGTKVDLPPVALVQHMINVMVQAGMMKKEDADKIKPAELVSKLQSEFEKAAEARNAAPKQTVAYKGVSTDGRRSTAD